MVGLIVFGFYLFGDCFGGCDLFGLMQLVWCFCGLTVRILVTYEFTSFDLFVLFGCICLVVVLSGFSAGLNVVWL